MLDWRLFVHMNGVIKSDQFLIVVQYMFLHILLFTLIGIFVKNTNMTTCIVVTSKCD